MASTVHFTDVHLLGEKLSKPMHSFLMYLTAQMVLRNFLHALARKDLIDMLLQNFRFSFTTVSSLGCGGIICHFSCMLQDRR